MILIRQNTLNVVVPETYTRLPKDASIYSKEIWEELCNIAGSEAALLEELEIVEDCRQPEDYHYIIPVIENDSFRS